jgi:hypothetical protein
MVRFSISFSEGRQSACAHVSRSAEVGRVSKTDMRSVRAVDHHGWKPVIGPHSLGDAVVPQLRRGHHGRG